MVPSDCCFYVYWANVHFHRKKKKKRRTSLQKLAFLGLIGVQTFKVIFLAIVGTVFKHLTKKNQSFLRLKDF